MPTDFPEMTGGEYDQPIDWHRWENVIIIGCNAGMQTVHAWILLELQGSAEAWPGFRLNASRQSRPVMGSESGFRKRYSARVDTDAQARPSPGKSTSFTNDFLRDLQATESVSSSS